MRWPSGFATGSNAAGRLVGGHDEHDECRGYQRKHRHTEPNGEDDRLGGARLLRRRARHQGRQPGHVRRRGDRTDRPVGLRQVHLPALSEPDERHGGLRPGRGRHHPGRREHLQPQAGRGAAARPRRHGVPEAQSVPQVDLRQHQLRPAHPRPGQVARRRCRKRACGTRSRTGWKTPAPRCRAASSSGCASRARWRSTRK